MTDYNDLRRLAEAAASGPWWTSDKLKCHPDLELSDDAAYIAAASPDVVLGLLDEIERTCDYDLQRTAATRTMEIAKRLLEKRDQLRDVAVRLKGYLENIRGNTRQDAILWDCEAALADPEVEKL